MIGGVFADLTARNVQRAILSDIHRAALLYDRISSDRAAFHGKRAGAHDINPAAVQRSIPADRAAFHGKRAAEIYTYAATVVFADCAAGHGKSAVHNAQAAAIFIFVVVGSVLRNTATCHLGSGDTKKDAATRT